MNLIMMALQFPQIVNREHLQVALLK